MIVKNTNIIIDGFNLGKKRKSKKYVYILSHMHADHYQGLTVNWDLGPVLSTQIT